MKDLDRALGELNARARFGMVLGLDRMEAALRELDHPERAFRAVHVTGSNGKGSVCAMVEAMARAGGLRTGLFTSPHLWRFAERIQIDRAPIEDALFAEVLDRSLRAAGGELTFFEVLTLAGFAAFRGAAVDLAIVEVGLGGRLDATNTLPAPLVTAITSVSLEHTEVLGDTIAKIASEKAGIFKRGCPVVLGALPEEAEQTAIEIAARVGAGPVQIIRNASDPRPAEVRVGGTGDAALVTGGGRRAAGRMGLVGAHQHRNAGVACAMAWILGNSFAGVTDEAIARGLGATWPLRMERVAHARGDGATVEVLFDGAHNPEGARALAEATKSLDPPWDPARTVLVFGALADKPYEEMLRVLGPLADRRIYAEPNLDAGAKGHGNARPRRSAPLATLAGTLTGEGIVDAGAALDHALRIAPAGGRVLVAGSLYMVAEARARLGDVGEGRGRDPAWGL